MAKRDLAIDLFRSFQTGKPTRSKKIKENVTAPSDPQLLVDLLTHLIEERDWKDGIAEGTLFSTWPKIVGVEISQHASPISLLDGVLTLQTSSTAWATQLQLVSPDLLRTIQASAPGVLVEAIVIIGPQGPSWKKGVRTIKGARGPRDTYG
jgi:predicted nucleic acid-binding Zn ribbon protein